MNNFFVARYLYRVMLSEEKKPAHLQFTARFPSEEQFKLFIKEQIIVLSQGNFDLFDSEVPDEWVDQILASGVLREEEIERNRGYVLLVGQGEPDVAKLEERGILFVDLYTGDLDEEFST